MDSKISKVAEQELVALTQRLSPEERVNAFLEHCRSMMAVRSRSAVAGSARATRSVRAKRSGESALLLLDVVDILVGQGVKYAVIDALAASVYGAVRASMDADVLLSVEPAQVQGLFNMLAAAGFKPHLAHGGVDDPIPAFKVAGGRCTRCIGTGRSLDVDMVRRLARGFSKDALEALERILRG